MNPLRENRLHVTRREFFGRSALRHRHRRAGVAARPRRPGAPTPAGRVGGLPGLPHFAPKAKRVIYLFQNGAPTHVDLFDYKPKLKELHGKPVPEAVRRAASASAP